MPHLPRIDVLRAYAILLVFSIHFLGASFGISVIPWRGLVRDYSHGWPLHDFGLLVPFTYGWTGVALFFVISGFCIHYSFLGRGEGGFSTPNFLWRRFVRLYPAYLGSLIFFGIYVRSQNPALLTLKGALTHLFLVHNLSVTEFSSINGVYWTLGVEFQFYLLYPFLLSMRKRYGLPACFAGSLVLNVGFFSFLASALPANKYHADVYFSFPLITWYSWILGACLAESLNTGKRCFSRPRWALGVSLALLIFAMNFKPLVGNSFLFAAVFFAVILEGYIAVDRPLHWRERLFVPLGLISYSFYLWHDRLIGFSHNFLQQKAHLPGDLSGTLLFYLAPTFAFTSLIAWISYRVLEKGGARLLLPWRGIPRSHSPTAIPEKIA